MITPAKWQQLYNWMTGLNIHEEDLLEKFILGSGAGGQKINKTSSCVWIKHLPTGMMIKCQQERSRELNRYFARYRLCEKIDFLIKKEKSQHQQAIQKKLERRRNLLK